MTTALSNSVQELCKVNLYPFKHALRKSKFNVCFIRKIAKINSPFTTIEYSKMEVCNS